MNKNRQIISELKDSFDMEKITFRSRYGYEVFLKNQVIRTDYARDGDPDWEENFYILRKTPCVAVLSENYFMDNKSDLEYLQNQTGKQAIIDTHVEGIEEWIESNI